MTTIDRLRLLGFTGTCPDTLEDVERLERLVGVPLPADYRDFLLTVGGGYVDAWSPCGGPTPFGDEISVTVLQSGTEVVDHLDSAVTPRNMICVSFGHGGMTGCLSVAGLDRGQVFALDTGMRYFWDEGRIAAWPHLAPSIKEFFRRRDADELPERPWGYENCYRMAGSFTEFLERLRGPNAGVDPDEPSA